MSLRTQIDDVRLAKSQGSAAARGPRRVATHPSGPSAEGGAVEWRRRLDEAAPGLVDRCRLIGRRPRSIVLRGHSPRFGDVSIKYDPAPGGRARMEAEYEALRAYRHAAGGSGAFGFAEPHALVPDAHGGAAFLASWIPCPRADERLARSLPFDSVRDEVLRRAAGWLAHFHRLGRQEERPLGSALDLPSLARRLGAGLGTGRGNGRDQDADALAEALQREHDTPVRFTIIHNDYLPQNLFLCPQRTIGIDFTGEVFGPALRDVGVFLANMVWRGYSTLDPKRSARFAAGAGLFLETYYAGAAPPERRVARIFVLAELARKAEALSGKIAGRRFGTSDRLHRMMILDAIRELLRSDRRA